MNLRNLFEGYIGIDYSGAATPTTGLHGLRVAEASAGEEPRSVVPGSGRPTWSRQCLAEWLVNLLRERGRVIVGMDHAFSFPQESLKRVGLATWDGFLDYFCSQWQTDQRSVEKAREARAQVMGNRTELRLTERWTSSAKSVFLLGGPGQVGKSTHAGIPWLRYIRRSVGEHVHFWPYDGFDIPADKSCVTEVYPAMLKNRYALPSWIKTGDERDAFVVCAWLRDRDGSGFLDYYLRPQLKQCEREQAMLEGWILGVL